MGTLGHCERHGLCLMGPNGVGKGTALRLLKEQHPWLEHVSSGDELRARLDDPRLGPAVREIMCQGGLAGDKVVLDIVSEWIQTNVNGARALVVDGIPRTEGQVTQVHPFLDTHGFPLRAVIVLDAPDAECLKRIETRIAAERAQAERDGVAFVERPDNDMKVQERRLADYRAKIEPLLKAAFISNRYDISTYNVPPNAVAARITEVMRQVGCLAA